jgi:hypothetical protein
VPTNGGIRSHDRSLTLLRNAIRRRCKILPRQVQFFDNLLTLILIKCLGKLIIFWRILDSCQKNYSLNRNKFRKYVLEVKTVPWRSSIRPTVAWGSSGCKLCTAKVAFGPRKYIHTKFQPGLPDFYWCMIPKPE